MKKRLTALLLVLSLVLSLGATVAFATDEDDVPVDPVVDDPIVEDPVVDDPDGDELQKARVDALYGQLMAAQSTAEVAALAENMTDAEISAFFSALTEDEYAALEAHLNDLAVAEYVLPETVVFTDAGPFMPAVNVAPVRRLLRAPATYQNDPEPADNGLVTQKTVTANDDGTYTIRLESWTTGKVTTSTKTIPVDIVLVLDQSGSMADDFSGNTTNTNSDRRQYAMKQAVNNFIEKVAEKYSTDADHRMAIVTFGSSASTLQGWTVVNESGKNILQGKINELPVTPSGATNVAAGMTQAETLMGSGYSYNGTNTQRQKVVIVFTDGVPTTNTDFDTTVATSAIASAKSLKDGGATVYTVGIFNGAKPEELYGEKWDYTIYNDISCSGEVGSYWGGSWLSSIIGSNDFDGIDIAAGNRFLNYLSSNSPDATAIGLERGSFNPGGHWGAGGTGYKITQNFTKSSSSYYLTASDSATLNNIFQTISDNIQTANIDLGSATVVKDVVTDYFDLPANASAITLYSAAAKADGTFDTPVPNPAGVTATVNNNAVTVTGFDYNANFVSETVKEDRTYGKKLIVEFTITPKQDFLGGDNVPTNVTASSGIYDKDGALVENYPNPGGQEVPVKTITPDVQNLNVYLANSTDLTALLKSIDSRINGTNNAFVTVTYTIKDGDTVVGTYTIPDGASTGSWSPATVSASLLEDKTYTVTCEVKPATSAAKTGSAEAEVSVFKPELTYQDATIYLGNSAPDFNSLRVGDVVWKNGTTLSTNVTMTGTAPTLNITYDKSTTGLTACTDVNATVKIGGTDVTESVKFWNYGEERGQGKAEFTVHVLKPSFQTTDVTIYLHNSTNLDDRVTTTGWSCVSEHDGSVTVPAVQEDAPAITYSFQVNNTPVSNQTAYAPTDCVNVAVTPKVGSVTLDQENLTFNVHVLYPSFEVTVNDVWANYDVNVDLKDNCIAAPVITWNDKNSTAHTPGQAQETAPISASTAFTFTCEKVSGDGSLENGVYTTGVQDADFKVTGIAYQLNGKEYSWSVAVKDADANAASHFTVHINHFDLVVNKTWTGDEIYRQDAIFTLTDTTANTSMKVVVRAAKGTVTIKNLVCGKAYSVAEDGNWVWRFLCGTAQNVACEANPTHGITKTAPGVHTVTKSFANTLKLLKWLDGSAYCNNNFADLNP